MPYGTLQADKVADSYSASLAPISVPFRNKLINGNFDIWQYGTSTSSAGYTIADRWKISVSGTVTFSQETSVVATGSRYALKWTTGASSSYGQIRQYIEYANLYPMLGKTIMCSALVRCNSTFTGNAQFEIGYATTSDSSSATYTLISGTATGTVNSSGYTQITWTGTVPSNAAGLYIGIVPTVVQPSGAILYMDQVQCELGSTATSFDYRPYGTELALCQRYYYKKGPTGSDGFTQLGFASIVGASSTNHVAYIELPVPMRVAPTSLDYSNVGFVLAWGLGVTSITALTIQRGNPNSVTLSGTLSSALGSNNGLSIFLQNNNSGGYVGLSAEL